MSGITQDTLDSSFLTGPGEELVSKLLLQLSRVKQMTDLFGPYKVNDAKVKNTDQQRWADYERADWSVRQLPAINIFESQPETKANENGYVTGTVQIQVYWPPSLRRGQTDRVPATFNAILTNFFSSKFCRDMLDEHFSIQRDSKVPGLNEIGKDLTWTPNVLALVTDDLVPSTVVDVQYRIDLRAWYRTLEYQGRTKQNPFAVTLDPLTRITGEDPNGYKGVDGVTDTVYVTVEDDIEVNNP